MATYQQVIDIVEREIRTSDAFPDASTKAQEQVDAAYRYVVAIAKDLPISRLPISESSNLSEASADSIKEFTLPTDIFDVRQDLGIASVVCTISGNAETVQFSEFLPLQSVKLSGENSFQQSNLMLSMDMNAHIIYGGAFIDSMILRYSKLPVKPTTGNVNTTDVPLDENSVEVLVEALASHFTSINARDLSASQIHSTLSQILSE